MNIDVARELLMMTKIQTEKNGKRDKLFVLPDMSWPFESERNDKNTAVYVNVFGHWKWGDID